MGQPEAMPLIRTPVWQKGMPQSMQRAPCSCSFSSGHVQMKLIPVPHALPRIPIRRQFALIFHKSGWLYP
jgi:hypothetical protein